jgi:hypothetical protein
MCLHLVIHVYIQNQGGGLIHIGEDDELCYCLCTRTDRLDPKLPVSTGELLGEFLPNFSPMHSMYY